MVHVRHRVRQEEESPSAVSSNHVSSTSSKAVPRKRRMERKCSRRHLPLIMLLLVAVGLLHGLFPIQLTSHNSSTVATFGAHPKLVVYQYETNALQSLPVIVEPSTSSQTAASAQQQHVISNNHNREINKDVCQPMHEWQSRSYVMCNPLHEFDIPTKATAGILQFINCGGDRCAFQISDQDGTPLALKVAKYKKTVEERHYESARKDGMVMERLTASKYVLTTYGYCGLSQVIEFGKGGSIHDLIKRTRLEGENKMTPMDKLKVGIQLVTSVADLHTFEPDGVASITHNDICCHQFILVDGVYKLNDFHLARLLTKNVETNRVCQHPMAIGRHWALIHSPEESNHRTVDTEKADDYVVGNVMYYVLTTKWIFQDVKNKKLALEYIKQGKRPLFPSHIVNSTDPADQALMKGIRVLWTHHATERPSSREVSNFLIQQLEKITGTSEEVVRVSIPALPDNWRYSDSSFDNNFYDQKD